MARPDISICICTYSRAESLAQTLRSLTEMSAPKSVNWEILVIDNNSSDHTKKICSETSSALPLKYYFEPIQGLSSARNRGIAECSSNFLVFTDDDMDVSQDWLNAYLRASERFPEAEYFGGKIVPIWNNARPRWLKDDALPLLTGLFGNYDLGESTRAYDAADPLPFGGNFAVKRTLFESVGYFHVGLGVKGSVPGRGEETDYLMRARALGAGGVYVGEAACYHRLQREKLKLIHAYRHGKQKGASEAIGGCASTNGSYMRAMRSIIRGVAQFARGRGDRFRQCLINAGREVGIRNYLGNRPKRNKA